MSVTYDDQVKVARMTATRDEFASGTLELLSAADVVLAVFTLSATGGTVAGAGVWTLAFTATSTTGTAAAGGGTAATKAQIKDNGGTARLTGLTVGVDVTIDNPSIADGQTVNLTGAQTITHAA